MFTRFRYHWAETCHCEEFRFYLTEELQTEALELSRFSLRFFSLKHCRDSLITVELYYLFWSLRILWPRYLPPLLEPTLVQPGELNSIPLSLTRHCQSFPWKGTTCWWPTHYASINWPMRLFPLQRTWHPHWLDSKPQKQMISCLSLSQLWLWGQTARN